MCYFEKQRVQGNQIWHSQTEPDPTRPDHYDDDDYDDDDYDDDDYDDNDPPLRKLSENSSSLVRAIIPKGRGQKKNRFFLGKSPKLWVGGGQES